MLWDPDNPQRRGLALNQPGALPVENSDQIRVEANSDRPAYMYLVWIDSQGKAIPVYPWTPGNWDDLPTLQQPVARLSLPEAVDRGWPMEGAAGMETLLLLARDEPLSGELDLASLFADLPQQQMQGPKSLVWFADGEVVDKNARTPRAPNFFDPQQIDDPVLQTQQIIRDRLGPHFETIRAISFAHAEN